MKDTRKVIRTTRTIGLTRTIKVNGKVKDRLFRLVFSDKADLLELYNAVNDSEYTNPDELIITTLEDVVYMGMKNDVSFIIDDILNLYEHQSTYNPNMPLRGFLYLADVYKGIVGENAFDINRNLEPCLKFKAIMLNINYGQNTDIMKKCRKLTEYAQFIDRIKDNLKRKMSNVEAVNLAVDSCIRDNILADILRKNRAEVCGMILTEYDEEKYLDVVRKTERNEGIEEGRKQGIEQGIEQGIRIFILDKIDDKITQEIIINKLIKRFGISQDEAVEYYEKYSKEI